MSDFISREAAIEKCERLRDKCGNDEMAFALNWFLRLLNAIPAADVQEVKRGEWFISIGKDGKPVGTICPRCGFAWVEAIDAVKLEPMLSLIETPYCPNCGAKMDKEECP